MAILLSVFCVDHVPKQLIKEEEKSVSFAETTDFTKENEETEIYVTELLELAKDEVSNHLGGTSFTHFPKLIH